MSTWQTMIVALLLMACVAVTGTVTPMLPPAAVATTLVSDDEEPARLQEHRSLTHVQWERCRSISHSSVARRPGSEVNLLYASSTSHAMWLEVPRRATSDRTSNCVSTPACQVLHCSWQL